MKITKIETIPFKLPLKSPFVISNVINYDMYYVLVKVHCDNGIIGYGEATPAWEVTGETYKSVVGCIDLLTNEGLLGYTLIGKDLSSLEQIKKIIEEIDPISKSQLIYGNSAAKASLEQALLDAYGKSVNLPIYKIFGGENRPIPFAKTISIYEVDKTLEKVQEIIDQEFDCIRLKIGIKNFGGLDNYERDVQVIKQVKKLIDKKQYKTKLAADANQGFKNAKTTISFCKKIDGCLDWLEQPIIASDLLGFKEIKQQVNTPLMADESVNSYSNAKLLLKLGGVDFINIKLMKTGGLLKALKIIDLAETFGVKCQIGSMIESLLGITMGCHTFLLRPNLMSTDLYVYTFLSDNLATGVQINKNSVILNPGPGSGVEVNKDLLEKYRLT